VLSVLQMLEKPTWFGKKKKFWGGVFHFLGIFTKKWVF
jgi:hypothetical protein